MNLITASGFGLECVDSLHFYVHDLERSRDHYVQKLDFVETGVSTLVFSRREQARASLVEAGQVRFVFMEPSAEVGACASWLALHPEGVGRIVFQVSSITHAYAVLVERGATPLSAVEEGEVEGSRVRWFDIATPFGDTLFRFVEREGDTQGLFPGMMRTARPDARSNGYAVSAIDHITSNFMTLRPAVLWMQEVLGLERYWGIEFHTQDVTGATSGGSGLKSIVMWDPSSGIKFANNEPAAPAFTDSQIYRFCVEHRGAGVQHVALEVGHIIDAVRGMRSAGVAFMPTPASYYELLPARIEELGIGRLEESRETLEALSILVDGAGPGSYLLQIFLREAAALFDDTGAGPLFIELIQRKGDRGFGAGNFRALFESIEREQTKVRAA